MEIGWQHQRRRREPPMGKEGPPWDKAELKRGRVDQLLSNLCLNSAHVGDGTFSLLRSKSHP